MRDDARSGGDSRRAQWLKGLAELALLGLLDDGPQYGLQLLDRIRADAKLDLAEGTIYPLLHRLERAGLTRSEWRLDDDGARPRKYYALTVAGRAELGAQRADWRRLSAALNAFLDKGTMQ